MKWGDSDAVSYSIPTMQVSNLFFERNVKKIMYTRKIITVLSTVAITATMLFGVCADDTRIAIDEGRGSWHGGVDDGAFMIYSKIWDHTYDNRLYKATVWVENTHGHKEEYTGTTYGINEDGEVIKTMSATFSYTKKNKAGYKNLSVVERNARQVSLKDPSAPSSYEAEFEFNPTLETN